MKPEDYPQDACTPPYKGPQPTPDDQKNMWKYLTENRKQPNSQTSQKNHKKIKK